MTNLDRALWRMNLHKDPIIPLPTPARRDHRAPASDEIHGLAASANRIDMIIGVFAFGVLFGMVIA